MKFTLILKTIFALLLGISITFFIFQDEQKFKLIVKDQIQKLAKSQLDCEIDCEIKNLNLLLPSAELNNVYVREKIDGATWFWKCKKIKIKCSWLDYFFTKKFKADLQLSDLEIYSHCSKDGKIAILPHINKLLLAQNSDLPLGITFLKLSRAKIELENKELQKRAIFDFNSESRFLSSFKTFCYLTDGTIFNNDLQIIKNVSGNLRIVVPNYKTDLTEIETNCICELPILDGSMQSGENNQCFIVGKWQNNNGNFKINTLNSRLNLDDINITKNGNKIEGGLTLNSKLSYIQKITNFNNDYLVEGDLTGKINFLSEYNNQNLNCYCIIKNISCNLFNFKIDELKFNLNKENHLWNANANLKKENSFEFSGDFNCDEKQKTAVLKFGNTSDIFLDKEKKLCIKPTNLSANFAIADGFKINGNYSLCLSNITLDKNINNSGKINFENNKLKIEGKLEQQNYFIELLTKPKFILKDFSFLDSENKKCIWANSNNNENVEILIDYKNLRKILPENLIPPFAGEGIIKLIGKINAADHPEQSRGISPNKLIKFNGKISLIDGNITISKTYNLIKNIEGDIEINFLKKCIILKNLNITLFKGSLECKQANITFNNELNLIEFLHFPIVLKEFFFNWKKDIFLTTTGFLLFQKNNNENSIKGNLIIDRGLLKNNILSDDFVKEIFNNQNQSLANENKTKINISLNTRKPIKIKTSFFETYARADLKIENTITKPQIFGSIQFNGGTLTFPYKCLNVINGTIYFLPNQSYDPIINLLARNKIRKYLITMHVTGSAKDSHIKFESSPPLSEEQIGTLLLFGSEKATLNAIMPSLITQNIKNIILGSAQAHSKMDKYFKAFLKPFKYVRFIPSFTDETGRAGFKGTVEIDVNDKLHASIEKNFSQSEDFQFEVDYDITDNVNFKALKDERGDLGAEVEMKWKW